MKIAVVGTGYVGLVSAACFADLGHDVIGMDIDKKKIGIIQSGKSPIYEPGLEEVLQRGLSSGRLSFTTDLTDALKDVRVVFCAVATPPNEDFSADLKNIFTVCENIAHVANDHVIFVNKSTVPIGTGDKCEKHMANILKKRHVRFHIPVVSNPEFLREGCAVSDTMKPDRIVVGINTDKETHDVMAELYRPLTKIGHPLLFMSRESAEIVKYAANAFLATKISFINMLSRLCEERGADIRDIAEGIGLDPRIGPKFLHAGIGYGGSCFPKDIKALIALSRETGIPMPIVQATYDINEDQRKRFAQRICKTVPKKAMIAIWGLSFKPNTDDMRDAPSIDIINTLVKDGHSINAFDPAAMENAKNMLPQEVRYAKSPIDAAKNADALVMLTEWDAFCGIEMKTIKKTMRGEYIFDGRNMYDPKEVEHAGLVYHGIGI